MLRHDNLCPSDLSFWRGGQFQHNNILWLQSAAELNRSNHVFDFHSELRPTTSFSSGKKKLEAEWEMCRRDYDARLLMMLSEGKNGGSTFSPTPTVESRPTVQLHNLKLLEDRSTSDSTGALGPRSRSDGWHFVLEDPKRPQVRFMRLNVSPHRTEQLFPMDLYFIVSYLCFRSIMFSQRG